MTKSVEPEDPLALVGVALERGPDDEALADMAWCFAEEYTRMGWTGDRILRAFHSPFYRALNQIIRVKGEDFVRGLIDTMDAMRTQAREREGR